MRRAAPLAFLVFVSCATMQLHLVEVQQIDTLYFGTSRSNGVVSDAEWKTFVAEVITPAYPGFTEWNAIGHWRGAEEATHVVQIAHPSRSRNDESVLRIINEYKRRFQQESVFWIRGKGFAAPK
jgi:Protein of unknown function (DUF3574)